MNFDFLASELAARRENHMYRNRHIVSSPQGVEITVDGKEYLNFCSNDYLGLANHPYLIESVKQGVDAVGVGSGSAHLVNGHFEVHHRLEQALAEFTNRSRALLFSTGYMANTGTLSALMKRGSLILADQYNHASIVDGAILSRAKLLRYEHNSVTALESRLRHRDANNTLIVSDGVFSMDGDIAPVEQMSELAEEHNALLMIDDAHGLGVLGPTGGGTLEQLGLNQRQVPILMGTLGKAFGTFGAFVAGEENLIEFLIQSARSYIYTTAIPPILAQASLAALQIAKDEPWRRDHLMTLVAHFKMCAESANIPVTKSVTPIQPIIVGTAQKALTLSRQLMKKGILVTAIRPPTVPYGSARLRITFSAAHTTAQVDLLVSTLKAML